MANVVEMNIGTKFKTKDFDNDLTSDVSKLPLEEFQRLLSEAIEDEEFVENPLSNPSRRNAILFNCADIIINVAQVMEYAIGEYPKPAISFDTEDIKDEVNGIQEALGNVEKRILDAIVLALSNDDEEYIRKEFASFYMSIIRTMCISAYGATKEIDLEPYILQRVIERS